MQVHSTPLLFVKTELPKELMTLIQDSLVGAEDSLEPATTEKIGEETRAAKVDLKERDCSVSWLSPMHWLSGMCWHYVMMANRDKWKYDLEPLEDPVQFTQYKAGEYFKWHIDSSAPGQFVSLRKLSFSLQLSDSDDYTGGDLQLMNPSTLEVINAPRDYGTLVIFPSNMTHQVTPVESGTRKALVGWLTGPAFK